MSSLRDVRHALLALHRTLLEAERLLYERAHGRQSAGAFLEAVIHAPELAWLQPLTALIVRLDEDLEGADESDPVLLRALRAMLQPDAEGDAFQQRYAEVIQRSPEAVMAHGALVRMLSAHTPARR